MARIVALKAECSTKMHQQKESILARKKVAAILALKQKRIFCKKIAQMHCNSLLLNCKTEKAKKIIEKFKIEAKKLQKIAIEREEEHAEKF